MLLNPKARRAGAGIGPLVKRLRFLGLDVRDETIETPDDLADAIRRGADSVDLAIVCGGDGTMNAAALAIMETGLPMGIVPMGTANDLARTLDIPESLEEAANIIAVGHTRTIDVGMVNDKPFFNVASIGLSTELADKLTGEVKRRWGKVGYALTAAKIAASANRFRAEIVTNDRKVEVSSLQIAVGNGRFYGGGTVVDARATIDDGRLDLYSLETRTVWKLALMLGAFRKGEQGAWDEVRTEHDTAFEIRTAKPMDVNADGDIITRTPARFEIRKKAITVFVP